MVLPGDILTAGADGTLRVPEEGFGFTVLPFGAGAAFPVTIRIDRSSDDAKNKVIRRVATVVEAAGFRELELRGAVAGSQWQVVVLTDTEDEYRPALFADVNGAQSVRLKNAAGGEYLQFDANGYQICTERPGALVQLAQYNLVAADVATLNTYWYKSGSAGVTGGSTLASWIDASAYLGVILIAEDGGGFVGGTSPTIQWAIRFSRTSPPALGADNWGAFTNSGALSVGGVAATINVNPFLTQLGNARNITGSWRPQFVSVSWAIGGTAPPTGIGSPFGFTLYGYN